MKHLELIPTALKNLGVPEEKIKFLENYILNLVIKVCEETREMDEKQWVEFLKNV